MTINILIKIRIILQICIALIVFIGAQNVPATSSGETQSLLEALSMASIIYILHHALWSEYIYNDIKNNGLNINYKTYQYVGLIVVSGMLFIVTNAYIGWYF